MKSSKKKSFVQRVINKLLTYVSIKCFRVLRGYALNRPQSILLEISSRCNLKCQLCPVPTERFRKTRPKKYLSLEDVIKVKKLVGSRCNAYVLNIWGESLLNNRIVEILKVLDDERVILSSNLNVTENIVQALIEQHERHANIAEFIVSMDGWDKHSYETYYRIGGDFDQVVRNLHIIQRSSLRNSVILQFLDDGTWEEADQRRKALEFSKMLGMKCKFTMMNMNFSKDGKHASNNSFCHLSYVSLYIDSQMNVMSCCSDPLGTINIQNVADCDSFQSLWNSRAMRSRSLSLLSNKNEFKVCRECDGNLFTFFS